MAKITIISDKEITVQAAVGSPLREAFIKAGVHVDAPCAGRGTCGKCTVRLVPAPEPGERDKAMLSAAQLEEGIRLLCCAGVQGDVTAYVQTGGHAEILIRGTDETLAADGSAAFKKAYLSPPSLEDAADCAARLMRSLEGELTLTAIADLPFISGEITVRMDEGRIVDTGTDRPLLGVAVDIGTTTVAAYLIDLFTGEELAQAACLNPQRRHGADVVSRCDYAAQGQEQLDELTSLIREDISRLTDELLFRAQRSRQDVIRIALTGNTVMQHLAAGVSPKNISVAPFVPGFTQELELDAQRMGFAGLHPEARVRLMPCIAGYVGADTVAAIMACGMDRQDDICLMVDIGTNGEIALGNNREIYTCATAAGPAFEGAHISCGMGGVTGAISRVWLEDEKLRISVIGGGSAQGVCGSGLLDAASVLLSCGALSPMGRLQECGTEDIDARLKPDGRGYTFRLAEGVELTQKDIRELQLAKGAIAAGIDTILSANGLTAADAACVYISGGMGSYMDEESACNIGLIPPEFKGRIKVIGNGAGSGAKRYVLRQDERRRARIIAQKTKYLELSARADFQEAFVERMIFGEE